MSHMCHTGSCKETYLMCVCVCLYRERERGMFKKLTHIITEASKLKVCKMGQEKSKCRRSRPKAIQLEAE